MTNPLSKKDSLNFLITGGSGMIGSFFCKEVQERRGIIYFAPSHKELDITKLDSIKKFVESKKINSIIHFAAFRNAAEAEKQRGLKSGDVWKVNVVGSKNIAKIAKQNKIYLIHISTDYVFSGHKLNPGPYSESDLPEKNNRLLSWYGITKKEAEYHIQNLTVNLAILRIGNVTRPGQKNEMDFIGKILLLFEKEKLYPMFSDQYLTLTPIPTLLDAILYLLESKKRGIFHIATKDVITPFDLANYLVDKHKRYKGELKSTSIDNYLKLNPKRYPKFGGLRISKTQKKLNLEFPSWKEVADNFIKGLRK